MTPGALTVLRYSLPYWSEVMRRPLLSTHIETHEPCCSLGTEYNSSALKPGSRVMRSTGVAAATVGSAAFFGAGFSSAGLSPAGFSPAGF